MMVEIITSKGRKTMKKTLRLTALALLAIASFTFHANAAEPTVFQPVSGGYSLALPSDRTEIYRTTKGIRYILGTQLINADVYSLPNFLAVPMKNYSVQQIADFEKFISDIEDFPGFTLEQSALDQETTEKKNLGSNKTDTTKLTPKLILNENYYAFTLKPPANSTITRDFITGRAYQLKNDKLVVVRVSAPIRDKIIAQQTLNTLTHNLKVSTSKYAEDNVIVAKQMNYEITLPSGWHAFTLQADNIIMAKSLSSVHHDEVLIRSFKTQEYSSFANATADDLPTESTSFVEKITKFTPNVTVTKQEPIVINGINGVIIESTDNVNLKQIFVVNAYFFAKDNSAYQIMFTTDDTINYDLKISAFKNAVKSFKKTNLK